MSEINNVSSVSSGVDYSASNVNTSSAASNESQVKDSSNINSASATEDSKKTDDSKKPEEPKDKDKTEKNKEKEELQKQIEELKKQLEELKKKLQEQQKPQGNCNSNKPQQPQQAQQAQQPNQNQNDPNQLILQDIIQVLEAEKNGGIGVQQAVNKLKQDYMMVKSMNVPLKPEVDQMAQQILQKYGSQEIGVNPLLGNQLAAGLNPTQAVNPLNNIQQPQTQAINF
jgi:Tfp pilus assembly protein FimV